MRTGGRAWLAVVVAIAFLLAACDAGASPTTHKTPSPTPAAAQTLYYAAGDGTLAALDAASGRPRWIAHLGGSSHVIAASGGLIYAATADGMIAALRSADGATAWTARVGTASQAMLVGGALVLLGVSGDAAVYALDATTGAVRWRRPAAPDDTLATGDDFVLVAHNTQTPVDGPTDGFLSALRIADGSEAWRFETGGETLGTPTVAAGTIYAPSSQGIFALDAATGAGIWHAATGAFNGVPALVDQDVYVATASAVLGVSPRDGRVLWRVETRNEIVRAALVGGTLYLATYDRLLALDAATGAQRWAYTGVGPLADLSARRAAYVADGGGALHAIDAGTGRELWHTAGMAPVAATDMAVYAVQGGDTVVALRADTGAVLWRFRAAGKIQPPVVELS